jgi:hypothetical protein
LLFFIRHRLRNIITPAHKTRTPDMTMMAAQHQLPAQALVCRRAASSLRSRAPARRAAFAVSVTQGGIATVRIAPRAVSVLVTAVASGVVVDAAAVVVEFAPVVVERVVVVVVVVDQVEVTEVVVMAAVGALHVVALQQMQTQLVVA